MINDIDYLIEHMNDMSFESRRIYTNCQEILNQRFYLNSEFTIPFPEEHLSSQLIMNGPIKGDIYFLSEFEGTKTQLAFHSTKQYTLRKVLWCLYQLTRVMAQNEEFFWQNPTMTAIDCNVNTGTIQTIQILWEY